MIGLEEGTIILKTLHGEQRKDDWTTTTQSNTTGEEV